MLKPVFLLAGLWFEVARRALKPDADAQCLGAYVLARRSLDRWLPGLWPWCPWCVAGVADDVRERDALAIVGVYFDGDPRAAAMADIGLEWGRGDRAAAEVKIRRLADVRDRTWAESVPIFIGLTDAGAKSPPLHRLVDGIACFEAKIERHYGFRFGGGGGRRASDVHEDPGVRTASALATGILVGWHEAVCSVWLFGGDNADASTRTLRARVRMVLETHAPGLCAAFDACGAVGARRVLPEIAVRTPADRARCYRAYLGFGEHAEIAAQGFLFGAFLSQERLDPLERMPLPTVAELRRVAEPRTIIDAALAATAPMRALDDVDPALVLRTSFDLHTACVRAMRETRAPK